MLSCVPWRFPRSRGRAVPRATPPRSWLIDNRGHVLAFIPVGRPDNEGVDVLAIDGQMDELGYEGIVRPEVFQAVMSK